MMKFPIENVYQKFNKDQMREGPIVFILFVKEQVLDRWNSFSVPVRGSILQQPSPFLALLFT